MSKGSRYGYVAFGWRGLQFEAKRPRAIGSARAGGEERETPTRSLVSFTRDAIPKHILVACRSANGRRRVRMPLVSGAIHGNVGGPSHQRAREGQHVGHGTWWDGSFIALEICTGCA